MDERATITGYPGLMLLDRDDDSEPVGSIQTLDMSNPMDGAVRAGVECPICKRELIRFAAPMGRVVKVERRINDREIETLIDPYPDTHHVFGCLTCTLGFSQPKNEADAYIQE